MCFSTSLRKEDNLLARLLLTALAYQLDSAPLQQHKSLGTLPLGIGTSTVLLTGRPRCPCRIAETAGVLKQCSIETVYLTALWFFMKDVCVDRRALGRLGQAWLILLSSNAGWYGEESRIRCSLLQGDSF